MNNIIYILCVVLLNLRYLLCYHVMVDKVVYKVGTLAADGWAVTSDTARTGLGGITACQGPSSLYQM